jgi:hypothetical protein
MSWSELERLVRDGERPGPVRCRLRGCTDSVELLLRARQLGYRITRCDLQQALLQHQQEQQALEQREGPQVTQRRRLRPLGVQGGQG